VARDEGMTTVSVLLTLHIEGAQTLKEKRAVVKSLVERLRARMSVAAAEVGLLDRPQAARVGFAVVAGEPAAARQRADEVRRFVDRELLGRAEVVATEVEETALGEG
jgi:uncharacterized protein YlxP (DUF503 family)